MRWIWPIAILLLLAVGCARRSATAPPSDRQQQIARLQEFSRQKGFPPTGNFRKAAKGRQAYYLCYFAPKWRIPSDYNSLGYRESDARGCRIDESKYDVYFHRVEAVAMEDTPITQALEEASEERALMVAAHEEAHEDPQLDRLPAAVAEAASTLLGMLTAAEFAMREGDTSTATHLSEDARIYRLKANAVNALHAALSRLYAEHRVGKRNRAETAAQKERLLEEHARACATFGRGHSINPCLPASNNAGVAFEHTYTRFYPLLYGLFEAHGSSLDSFLKALRKVAESGGRTLDAVEQRLRQAIAAGPLASPCTSPCTSPATAQSVSDRVKDSE